MDEPAPGFAPSPDASPERFEPAVAVAEPEEAAVPAAATHAARPASRPLTTSALDLVVFAAVLLGGVAAATLLVLRRWPSDSELPRRDGLYLLLAILVTPWLVRRRVLGIFLAGVLGCAIWMSALLYHGDWSWKSIGFEYGTRKFTKMTMGTGSNGNLPSILEGKYGWNIRDSAMTLRLPDLVDRFHWIDRLHLVARGPDGAPTGWAHDYGLDGTPTDLTIRQLLMGVFVALLLLCGLGSAIQGRRNDPRILSAFAAAWAVMAAVLCQVSPRYHIWGVAVSSGLIAVSAGLSVMHVIVSLMAAGMIFRQIVANDPSRSPQMADLFAKLWPDGGWVILMAALVYLYVALAPGRRPGPDELEL